MKRYFLLLCSLLVVGASQASGYRFDRDILYRADAPDAYAQRMCRLDVAWLPEAKDAPVVVWFHGGGLTGGRRDMPQELMQKGFVVVGVGYRLIPHVATLDIVDDAAAAVAWVFDHIADYGGSPSKIYIAGHSAGGYLVNMVGLDRSRLARYGKDADALAGIIPFSGHAITHFATREALGMTALQPLVDDTAPLFYVRPDCAPVLILSGDRELEMNAATRRRPISGGCCGSWGTRTLRSASSTVTTTALCSQRAIPLPYGSSAGAKGFGEGRSGGDSP